jgi:FKBP-type peptidyl-prolyl cis-trans isomerase 2
MKKMHFIDYPKGVILMKRVEDNDTVTLAYTGTLDNGEVFATITEQQPFILALGKNQAPPTLERALLGMSVGDTKDIRLSPEEGYGPRRKELVHTLDRKSISNKITPKRGMILSLTIEKEGKEHQVPATIIEVNDDSVVVDYNHPLAGHHLTYVLTVIDIGKSL